MRKYYILEKSVQGIYPKVRIDNLEDVTIASDIESHLNKVDPKNLNLQFTLKYHAKVTDVLTSFSAGSTNFLISDRFREVLDTANLMKHMYFDAIIKNKDKEIRYNWLTLMRDYQLLDYIDYNKSVFHEIKWSTDIGQIIIKSFKHYESLHTSASFGVRLQKIVLLGTFDYSLDMFFLCPFDFNVYVSEN